MARKADHRKWDEGRSLGEDVTGQEGEQVEKEVNKDEEQLEIENGKRNEEYSEDERMENKIFRNGRVRSNSFGERRMTANGKKEHDKLKEISSPMGKRRITWADGTAEPRQSRVAVSIPRHKNMSAGYTVYILELWYDGRSWSIKRRFSDFYEFHQELLLELWDRPLLLPELPTKAWLNLRLWFNKFDEEFLLQRRQQLQEYIRALVKVENLVETSYTLQQFLEINPSSPSLRSASTALSKSIDRPNNHLIQAIRERNQSEEESVEGGRISFFGPNEYIQVDPNTSHITA